MKTLYNYRNGIKMSKIKKIMVAVDFSDYSSQITDYAARLAEGLDAELLFVSYHHPSF